VLSGCVGCVGCFLVSDAAQIELRSGRVSAPALGYPKPFTAAAPSAPTAAAAAAPPAAAPAAAAPPLLDDRAFRELIVWLEDTKIRAMPMVGPGRYCSPRHGMPCNSRSENRGFQMRVDDVAGIIWQASRLLSCVASYDVAGNIWQALSRGAARRLARGGRWRVAERLRRLSQSVRVRGRGLHSLTSQLNFRTFGNASLT